MFQLASSSSGGNYKSVKGGQLLLILKQFSFLQNLIVISIMYKMSLPCGLTYTNINIFSRTFALLIKLIFLNF